VQDSTQLAQYNVCRLVDRLEREDLVERRQCPLDARNNVLLITPRPHPAPGHVAGLRRGHRGAFGAHLSETEAEQLARLLGKLVRPEA